VAGAWRKVGLLWRSGGEEAQELGREALYIQGVLGCAAGAWGSRDASAEQHDGGVDVAVAASSELLADGETELS